MKKSILLLLVCFLAVGLFAQNAPTDVEVDSYTGLVTWDDPAGTPGWMHYDNGHNTGNIGTGAAANFDAAIRWDVTGIAPYAGLTIEQIRFHPSEAQCDYTLKIWTGANAANEVMSQVVAAPSINEWNSVTLTTPYQISGTEELWIGYNCNTTTGHPAGTDDSSPTIGGYGNMMYYQGSWRQLTSINPELVGNWNIQAYAADNSGRPVAIANYNPESIPATPVVNPGFEYVASSRVERTLLGFNVYLDGTAVASNIQAHEFLLDPIDLIPNAEHIVGVSATHDSGESTPVNVTFTYQPPFYGIFPPSNVSVIETGGVLTWDEPIIDGTWIGWSNDTMLGSIGWEGGGSITVANRWATTDLADYTNTSIIKARFVPGNSACIYTMKIWTGANAANLIWQQEVDDVVSGVWNEILLPTAIPIDGSQEIWVGYTAIHADDEFPAAYDNTDSVVGKGDKVLNGGQWLDASVAFGASFSNNWMIGALTFDGTATRTLSHSSSLPQTIDTNSYELATNINTEATPVERSLTSYNVYLDGQLVGEDVLTDSYVFTGLTSGSTHLAGVASVYHEGESDVVELPFTYYPAGFFYEPTDLTAVQNDTGVQLDWVAPIVPDYETMSYCSDENYDGIGGPTIMSFDVASRWTLAELIPYHGMYLTEIDFYAREATCDYTVKVWTGNNAINTVAEVPVTNPTINAWNTITLPTPIQIDMTEELWFGLHMVSNGTNPAPIDAGPAVAGRGDMIRLSNSWVSITEDTAGGETPISGNWNIKARTVYDITPDRDADSYEVYHSSNGTDFTMLGTTTELTYTHDVPAPEAFNYYQVKAVYDGSPSNPAEVNLFVMPDYYETLLHDDNTSEIGVTAGPTNKMAVKFSAQAGAQLEMIHLYIDTPGTSPLIYRIYDNDGPNGTPLSQVLQSTVSPASIVTGWNTILLPEGQEYTDEEDGIFYVCIVEIGNVSVIGKDTSSNGYSFLQVGTSEWTPITDGNIMIRATVNNSTDTNEQVAVQKFELNNFPNPFNPETTIKYSVPTTGHTTLKIYNMRGQLVDTLVNGNVTKGSNEIVWKADNHTSGVYFYKLENGGQTKVNKMVLMK